MRTRALRGTLTVLLAGAVLVPAIGTTAHADPGKGTGKENGKARSSTSGADRDCGEYCSTRDGSPSRNGNGGGEATGRPCAGCVGRADDKNPPGQYPNGSDANNGYECDGNAGIARSNPAHTGCTPVAGTAPVAGPAAAPAAVPNAAPVAKAPARGTFRPLAAAGGKAKAESPAGVSGVLDIVPNVLGTRFERTALRPGAAGSRGGALPTTGTSAVELLLAGAALVVVGAVVTRSTAQG